MTKSVDMHELLHLLDECELLLRFQPIPVAARSKGAAARFAGNAGSNLAGGMDVSLVNVVCCMAKVSATGRSLVRRSPTDRERERERGERERVCVCVIECDQVQK